jgi:hypothetical protein
MKLYHLNEQAAITWTLKSMFLCSYHAMAVVVYIKELYQL